MNQIDELHRILVTFGNGFGEKRGLEVVGPSGIDWSVVGGEVCCIVG